MPQGLKPSEAGGLMSELKLQPPCRNVPVTESLVGGRRVFVEELAVGVALGDAAFLGGQL